MRLTILGSGTNVHPSHAAADLHQSIALENNSLSAKNPELVSQA